MMRSNAGLHPDQARRHIRKASLYLATRPLLTQHDRAAMIESHDVERVLPNIDANYRWRETGVEETVPAVAADNGDVAMPLAEAFAYYGTPRGAVPNYINSFAVQSWANTSTFDAIGAAKLITVPTIVIHSEKALAPSLARRFQADLNNARVLWVETSGQIDFYDDPGLIAIGADAVTRFFTAAARQ